MALNNNYPYPNRIIKLTPDWWRNLLKTIENTIDGKTNNTGEVTLEASADSTVVNALLCNPNSVVLLTPTTANAGTEAGSGNLYVVAGTNSFEIFHTNDAMTGRTFRYAIVG